MTAWEVHKLVEAIESLQGKEAADRVVLFFLWLPSAETAIARFESRVKQGGHNVPASDIRRRYVAGLRNLFSEYHQKCDELWLLDASEPPPKLIASERQGKLTVKQKRLYQRIQRRSEKN